MHSVLSSTTLLFGVLATSVLATPQYGDSGSSSSTTSASSAAASDSSSSSNVHSVKVGPALSFSPDTITAAEGDFVEFTFTSGHSVAQSSFDAPCVPLAAGGFYSGFPDAGKVWRVQVNSTDPIWVYCSASGHCEGGMAMVINQASSGQNTLDAYKSAAANAQGSSPETVSGGDFGPFSEESSGGSNSSSSGSSSTTPSATPSATGSSGNGASSNVLSTGLMILGALAAGAAAYL